MPRKTRAPAPAAPSSDDPVLSQQAAARYIGRSARYLRERADLKRQPLPSNRPGGRASFVYRRSELNRWLAAQEDPASRASAGANGVRQAPRTQREQQVAS